MDSVSVPESESGVIEKGSLGFSMQFILCHTCPEFVSVQTLLMNLNILGTYDWLRGKQ